MDELRPGVLYVPQTLSGVRRVSNGCKRALSAKTFWTVRVSKLPVAHVYVWTQASLAREMTWSKADLTWRFQ